MVPFKISVHFCSTSRIKNNKKDWHDTRPPTKLYVINTLTSHVAGMFFGINELLLTCYCPLKLKLYLSVPSCYLALLSPPCLLVYWTCHHVLLAFCCQRFSHCHVFMVFVGSRYFETVLHLRYLWCCHCDSNKIMWLGEDRKIKWYLHIL